MTEEEKKIAEEYFKATYPVYIGCDKFTEDIKDAVIYGLKAGKPKWHKVADGDLPKTGVQVLSEQGALVIYKGVGFGWVEYSPNADNIKLRKWEEPIDWCEIPQYTDKE